jgi:hypothetical protein
MMSCVELELALSLDFQPRNSVALAARSSLRRGGLLVDGGCCFSGANSGGALLLPLGELPNPTKLPIIEALDLYRMRKFELGIPLIVEQPPKVHIATVIEELPDSRLADESVVVEGGDGGGLVHDGQTSKAARRLGLARSP